MDCRNPGGEGGRKSYLERSGSRGVQYRGHRNPEVAAWRNT